MNLFFRKTGTGQAIILLHGVYGSSDNLFTMAKKIAENGFCVYLLDARNHGQSPRSENFNYKVMANDLATFIKTENLHKPIILGHSMGGKTVMEYAQAYDNYEKLVIVDIAPKEYPAKHQKIIEGLAAIPIKDLESRKQADEIFSIYVTDFGVRQFILKNIYRKPEGGFDWRINVPVISRNINEVAKAISQNRIIEKPVLFMSGQLSDYVIPEDIDAAQAIYTNVQFESIEGANHWVHASKPNEFLESLLKFIKN